MRDQWLLWTNPHALRLAGHRMGANRVRRLRRANARHDRRVKMKLNEWLRLNPTPCGQAAKESAK